jgi:hypothetical protein
MVIGDTGTGKSSFGNLILGRPAFVESDSPDPVTMKTTSASSIIDGTKHIVIDSQGLRDGQSVTAEQVQELALFLKNWDQGVNAIAICLNGQNDRFSQSARDIIRFVYNAFATLDVMNHIFVVFTRCFGNQPNCPNRQTKSTEYRDRVQKFLQEISGSSSVPEIPIFFVDSKDPTGEETKRNMIQFNALALERHPLESGGFKAVAVHDKVEEESQKGVITGEEIEGDTKYRKMIDRKREKITPYNGDKVRYSEWETTRSWRETIGTRSQRTETRARAVLQKVVDHHKPHSKLGFSSYPHSHYTIKRTTWTESREVITDFEGCRTETEWRKVEGSTTDDIRQQDRESGFTAPWVQVEY